MNLILGAGLSGLSASYHLGHEHCLILEKNLHAYGHLHVEFRDGYTWDQGPHVSFTKNEYVRALFENSVGPGGFDEYVVSTANFYRGHWIDHPAQTALYQVPDPLRSECLASFLASRAEADSAVPPADYAIWLERAFGPVFAHTFPFAYTRKYWTREPSDLGVDWVGGRVFQPKVEDVIAGSRGPLGRAIHYITKVRYPRQGGYQAFARGLAKGAKIQYGAQVVRIDLKERRVQTADGASYNYTRLINTLPLPVFVSLCAQATPEAREAAAALLCSQLLLINVTAPHSTRRAENWMYVYDEEKLSTRINCTEKLTPGNAPPGHTGVQVEVYFSRHRPLPCAPEAVVPRVKKELVEMGLIDADMADSGRVGASLAYAPWANVVFDHGTRPALERIWSWLETHGLAREPDDVHPLTDWSRDPAAPAGTLLMAGRFGQWKYYWSDDCVLRGRCLAGNGGGRP